jgi:hypothetical protein
MDWLDCRIICPVRLKEAAELFQRLDIRNQGGNLRRLKFSGERRHLARFTLADSVGNPVVGKIQIVQVRSIVTMCGGTMTMRAVS